MNKIYSKVWSKTLGQLVVASELSRTSGPAGSGKGRSGGLPFALFSVVTVGSGLFGALPVGASTVQLVNTACGASGLQGAGPNGATFTNTSGVVDGSDYLSTVAGCSASGGGKKGVTVYGNFAQATGDWATAVGFGAQAANLASSFGPQAIASGQSSVAMGFNSKATGINDTAVGTAAAAAGGSALALADRANAGFMNSIAIGVQASAQAVGAVAAGPNSSATGASAVAFGDSAQASAAGSVAIGKSAVSSTANGVALGAGAAATGATLATAAYAVGGTATVGGEVNIANGANGRRLTGLAAGANGTDAANVSQLNTVGQNVVAALGGGAALNAATGTWTAPAYSTRAISTTGVVGAAATVSNAGAAITSLDTSLGNLANDTLKYDDPTTKAVATLGGTLTTDGGVSNGSLLTNLHQGALTATSSDAVNGAQLFNTNSLLAAAEENLAEATPPVTALQADALQWNATLGAYDASHGTATPQKISNVATGTADTDAVNVAQLNTVSTAVSDAGDRAVTYDGAVGSAKDTITLAGTAGTKISNVTAGDVSAASTDAVNGAQLNTTNQQVAGIDTRVTADEGTIASHTTKITALQTDALQWNATLGAYDASHGTATPQKISNVATGTADADAVNVAQLNAVSTAASDASDRAVTYDGAVGSAKDTITLAGTAGTKISNVTAGDVSASSTDAINGAQLNTTNLQVAGIDTRVTTDEGTIAGHTTQITALQTDALQWSATLGAYDASHGTGAPQKISNVATGTAATDAVNVAQLDAVSTSVGNVTDRSVTYDGAVGSAKDTITLAGTAGTKISNLAAGDVSATSTDAVNGAQLNTTNQQVAGIDTRVTTVEGAIAGNATEVGALQTDALQWNATLGAYDASHGTANAQKISNVATGTAATDAVNVAQLDAVSTSVGNVTDRSVTYDGAVGSAKDTITLAGTAGTKISNLAAGDVSATSTDAVNGAQLNTTNQQVAGIDTRVTTAEGNIAANTTQITSLQTDALQWNATLGAYDAGHGAGSAQKISNVAAGTLDATSTDAVNGAQLFATDQRVDAIEDGTGVKYFHANSVLADGVATGTDSIAIGPVAVAGADSAIAIGNGANVAAAAIGSVALGSGASATGTTLANAAYAVGGTATAGGEVNIANGGQGRRLTGLAAGANATDAVNVAQLNLIGQNVATALGGGTSLDPATGLWTAPAFGLTHVDATGAATTQTFANVGDALGDLSDSVGNINSTVNAINGGDGIKYFHANSTLADSSATGTDSVAIGPESSATIAGSVALGLGAVSDRALAPTTGSIAAGSGAVHYDTTDGALLGAVSVGQAGQYRQITNVADANQDHDAVTLRQLTGAITSLSATGSMYFHANSTNPQDSQANGQESIAVGPGTVVNGDNGIGVGNTATVDQADGIAIGRDTHVAMASGVALGSEAAANGEQSMALGAGATSNFSDSVALGSGSTDTVGAEASYMAYGLPGAQTSIGEIAIGSALGNRKITGLAPGTADNDAVNVAQLKSLGDQVDQNTTSITNLDGRVTNLENRPQSGPGTPSMYFHSNSSAADSQANGANSVAIGPSAISNGTNSVAIGNGSAASANNAVAIGPGSVADRDNTVSVGSQDQARQVTNVAAGTQANDAVNVSQLQASEQGGVRYDTVTNADGSVTNDYTNMTLNPGGSPTVIHNVGTGVADTDAVNVGQLNTEVNKAIDWSKSYTDQRFNTVNQQLDRMGTRVNSGIAAAMAMASLPQAYQAGQNAMAMAAGNFHGESSLAVGVSRISESGRWIYKVNLTSTGRGDGGVGAGSAVVW